MNEVKLTLKNYQVRIHGFRPEQGDDLFIRTPENVSEDLKSRNLGGSRYLNLHLIEDFKAKTAGNFGGSGSDKQATMFETTSPLHFGMLVSAIEGGHYEKETDMEISVIGEEKKRIVPVIKLNGVFEDSVIYTEAVDAYYLAYKKDGIFELQITERWVGDDWLNTPSEQSTISVVLFGAEANEGNLIAALSKESRRANIEAFNKDVIKEMAADNGISMASDKMQEFKTWFAGIAPTRIKRLYNEDLAEAEEKPTITQGDQTGQPGSDAATQSQENQTAAEPKEKVV